MVSNEQALAQLALNGGPKVRQTPWPARALIGSEERAAVNALLDETVQSGREFGYDGPAEEAYCREFAEFMGGGYADAVSSGTTAIYVALKALEIEPFTEVIVSSITDNGGTMPVPLVNCIPIVADTAPGSFNIGPEQIEACITPLTRAIIVAHIFGEPADMKGIMAVADRHGIPVIEDCAQAHCARLDGKLLGTFGKIGAFSTMGGKHHCTGGQGGVVFTTDEDLYWRSRRASDRGKPFGLESGSTNSIASLNLNLNDLAAAIGRAQLSKLPGFVAGRRRIVAELSDRFANLRSVVIPEQMSGAETSYWYWRLRLSLESITCDKETFCKALQAEGVQLTAYYQALPHTYEWFTSRRVFGTSGYPWSAPEYGGDRERTFPCPNATEALARHMHLVVYESWGPQEIDDIATAFEKVERAYLKPA
jgi:dTDP-4-amino-4,6-dideoxygalactose transaminase